MASTGTLRFVRHRENIDKADSMDSAVSEIAALLDTLNDSHTVLLLPPRNYVYRYGFSLKMIGRPLLCYSRSYRQRRGKEGSSARRSGPGGEQPSGYAQDVWKIEYVFHSLRPQPGLRLTLLDRGRQRRQLNAMTKVEPSSVIKYRLQQGINQMVHDWTDEYALLEPQYYEKNDRLLRWEFLHSLFPPKRWTV